MNRTEMLLSPLVLITFCLAVPIQLRADHYAFLVGVSDYDAKQLTPLAYSRSDITAFHDVLVESGFAPQNIVLMHDDTAALVEHYRGLGEEYDAGEFRPEADKIREELSLLLPLIDAEDTLIVAFAGHGVKFKGEEESYFCALDADLDDPERESLISFADLYGQLEACRARRKLLLVDACRNDPQSRLSRSQSDVELESVTTPQLTPPPEGLVALFSCAPGQQAFEFPELEHGIFFYHVLQAWRGDANGDDSQLSLDELIDYTKRETGRFARLRLRASQTPRQRGFFEGEWILREIESPDTAPSRSVSGLLANVDLARDSVEGRWRAAADGVSSPAAAFSQLVIPATVPREYELTMTVRRDSGSGAFVVGLPVADRQCIALLDPETTRLEVVDGEAVTGIGGVLISEDGARLKCAVRSGSIRVTIDEHTVLDWAGDPAVLTVPAGWKLDTNDQLFVGSVLSEFTISEMELKSLE